MRNENVVEFPTGRPIKRPAKARKMVAIMVRKLAAGVRLRQPGPGRQPISVQLRDLTGVADETVDTLASLAGSRVLTPATAARLALRHAFEIGRPYSEAAGAHEARTHGHRLVLAGDVFGSFAIRIEDRASGAWVARSRFSDLDLLSGLCPAGSVSLHLMTGPDAGDPPVIDVRAPRARRVDPAHSADGSDRIKERQLLIVGGLPSSTRRRAAVVAGIEDALRRGGMRVRTSNASSRIATAGAEEWAREARRHLVLIEIACPGLVGASGGTR
jgi:hypothetical protein